MKVTKFDPEFFVETALRLQHEGALSDEHQAAFSAAIAARAIYAARRDADQMLEAEMRFPGYLHRKVDARDVFVPFNLAYAFPSATVLADAIGLGEAARLGYGHPICLSGSATFLGRLAKAVDIDFCEYYATALTTLTPAICSKTGHIGSPYLVSVKCAGTNVLIPCEGLRSRLDGLMPDGPPTKVRIKLDFVGVSARFGVIPLTNVVIPVPDGTFGSEAAQASFAFQEAVVCVTSPPRGLLDVNEFVRYLDWVVKEAKAWVGEEHASETKAPLKSLKRSLSAFLLMGFDLPRDEIAEIAGALSEATDGFSPVDLILSSLNEGILARVADDLRVAELRSLAPLGHASVPEEILRQLDSHVPLATEPLSTALDGARDLAEGLSGYLDDLFEKVGAGLT